ncbi:MAG: prepilin-type N-terminal cleavage/methylation domain-containing protein [Vicinamibacterales bacterium]
MTHTSRSLRSHAGFTLLETAVALSVLLIVSLGLVPLGIFATTTTENQGHLMARTTEYAQDKLEQLLALAYGDTTSDTRAFPATDTGGSGLAVGGSADPNAPVALYVDYLDINGTLLPSSGVTAPSGWFYKRVWSIGYVAGSNNTLKQLKVTATVKTHLAQAGSVPQATVASLKTYPF